MKTTQILETVLIYKRYREFYSFEERKAIKLELRKNLNEDYSRRK